MVSTGNFQLANPVIHIKQAFHDTKELKDCRTASYPYKSDRRPPISDQHRNADIEVISEPC